MCKVEHSLVNADASSVYALEKSSLFNTSSNFIFIYPLSFRLKNKKIYPSHRSNDIMYFDFEPRFVGKTFLVVYENGIAVKEYVFEK